MYGNYESIKADNQHLEHIRTGQRFDMGERFEFLGGRDAHVGRDGSDYE